MEERFKNLLSLDSVLKVLLLQKIDLQLALFKRQKL